MKNLIHNSKYWQKFSRYLLIGLSSMVLLLVSQQQGFLAQAADGSSETIIGTSTTITDDSSTTSTGGSTTTSTSTSTGGSNTSTSTNSSGGQNPIGIGPPPPGRVCSPNQWDRHLTGRCVNGCKEQQSRLCNPTGTGWAQDFGECNGSCAQVAPPAAPPAPPAAPPSQETFTVCNGQVKTLDQLTSELRGAGYPGPWDINSMLAAYTRAACPAQTTPPPACVPNGSCSANPACGMTATGTDNCGNSCQRQGPACPVACVSNGSCSANPACGTTATGVDNCGNSCQRTGPSCVVACIPNGSCSAQIPTACGQTFTGVDNCGNVCRQTSSACQPVQGPITVNPVITNNPTITNTFTPTNTNTITVNTPAAVAAPATFANVGVGTSVAGVQYVSALPKTGLPAIAWSALAFIPAGFRMRRFSKVKKDLENHPSYIFEDRQYKSMS